MRDILVAGLISAVGEVSSRVKLQKLIYLLQRMGSNFEFYDFSLRDFGPFAPELASTIDCICAEDGMVIETKHLYPDDVVQYSYRAKPSVAEALNKLLDDHFGAATSQLRTTAGVLVKEHTRVLEVAATAIYIRDELFYPEDEVWEEVQRLKGHLSNYPSLQEEARKLLAQWDSEGALRRSAR